MIEANPGAGAEGSLAIFIGTHRRLVASVTVKSSRPLMMPQIFVGKRPDELISLLPLLYSVCGVAQGCAAALALEQALGIPGSRRVNSARRLLVCFESLREHLWRVELDWAGYLGTAPRPDLIALVSKAAQNVRQMLFGEVNPFLPKVPEPQPVSCEFEALLEGIAQALAERIYHCAPERWLQLSTWQELDDWTKRGDSVAARMLCSIHAAGLSAIGSNPVAGLPALEPEVLERRLQASGEEFVAYPSWCGKAWETGALPRQAGHPLMSSLIGWFGNGLLPHLAARLLELATLMEGLRRGGEALEHPQVSGLGGGSRPKG